MPYSSNHLILFNSLYPGFFFSVLPILSLLPLAFIRFAHRHWPNNPPCPNLQRFLLPLSTKFYFFVPLQLFFILNSVQIIFCVPNDLA
jgi:hypothetical protein